MDPEVTEKTGGEPIRQFAVFAENKVGRLNELVALLGKHNIHPLAISTQDTTDSTIIRMVVDDPDQAHPLLIECGHAFSVSELVVPEFDDICQLREVLAACVAAEVNIHYCYPFIARPRGKCALAMHVEDNEIVTQVLRSKGLRTLQQTDLAR